MQSRSSRFPMDTAALPKRKPGTTAHDEVAGMGADAWVPEDVIPPSQAVAGTVAPGDFPAQT
jgi:hypothetical protein